MKKTTLFRFSSDHGVFIKMTKTFAALLLLMATVQLSAQNCQLNCLGSTPGSFAAEISVNMECGATIDPADFLIGEEASCTSGDFLACLVDGADTLACGNPLVLAPGAFELRIYTLVIHDLTSGNSCWSSVIFEDKLGPTIECEDIVINCLESINYLPTASDNCDPNPSVVLTNSVPIDTCDERLVGIEMRTYRATDNTGKSSECTQRVEIERLDTDEIEYPEDADLDCAANYAKTNAGGVTDAPHPSATGQPTLDGRNIWSNQLSDCNIIVGFTDVEVPFGSCHNGVKRKIFRTWSISEWFCDGTDTTFTRGQKIEIIDDEGPVLVCPDDIDIAAGIHDCDKAIWLPAITATDNCCPVTSYEIRTPNEYFFTNGAHVTLPVGIHDITYFAEDECGNRDSCSMTVTISDMSPPEPVCNSHTTVGLTSNGTAKVFAETFDDGSHDNCGPVYFKVRRMNIRECGGINGDDNPNDVTNDEWFDDYAKFCCADIDNGPIMVIFRVFDVDPGEGPVNPAFFNTIYAGHYNDCMVEVTVQDKLPPTIVCPNDITVSCEFDYDIEDLAATFGDVQDNESLISEILITDPAYNGNNTPRSWGYDGFGTDNCDVTAEELTPVVRINTCGDGHIIRRFKVTDSGDREAYCNQRIDIINTDPYSPLRNAFPRDVTLNECNIANLEPGSRTGNVNISNDTECSSVTADHEDQLFEVVPGACFKILRTWTIVDWCQFDSQEGSGIWTRMQIIKVINNDGPTFTSACTSPAPVESNDANCSPAFVSLMETATDDCTPIDDLVWDYEIDLDNDNSVDRRGRGNDASGNYPVGVHNIKWTVEDKCNNKKTCEYTFSVISTTKPQMYCDGIVIVLGDDATAEVWASDVDLGSTHPCGNDFDLSFSGTSVVSNMTFDCSHLGDNVVRLYGIDYLGNVDYCEVVVTVQDNTRDVCPDGPNPLVTVRGEIFTEDAVAVSNAEVNLDGGNVDPSMTTMEGIYSFADMNTGGAYTVRPFDNDHASEAISTLDLILIQRHILGMEEFESPYKIIASDGDNSGEINVLDLLVYQQLILGLTSELPNGNTSWKFIDADYRFNDDNPLDDAYPLSYQIDNLVGSMLIDFVGVKMGDVNGSYQPSGVASTVVERSGVQLTTEEAKYTAGELVSIDLTSITSEDLAGMQFSLDYNGSIAEFVGVTSDNLEISENNYTVNGNQIKFNWFDAQGKSVTDYNTALTLQFRMSANASTSQIFALSNDLNAEAYDVDMTIKPINLVFNGATSATKEFTLYQNTPNPFSNVTMVNFDLPEAANVTLNVFDISGKVVYTQNSDLQAGFNTIELQGSDLNNASGVLYYQLSSDSYVATKKMIRAN